MKKVILLLAIGALYFFPGFVISVGIFFGLLYSYGAYWDKRKFNTTHSRTMAQEPWPEFIARKNSEEEEAARQQQAA